MYTEIEKLGYSPGIQERLETSSQPGAGTEIPEPIAASLTAAASSGKLLLVDFYAEWCAACILLEQTTLNDPMVVKALDNYVYLKVDTDLHVQAADFYQVVGMPTLLVLTAEGEEIYRSVGPIGAEEFSRKLNDLPGH